MQGFAMINMIVVVLRKASAFSYASRYILSKLREMNTGWSFVYFQNQSSIGAGQQDVKMVIECTEDLGGGQ